MEIWCMNLFAFVYIWNFLHWRGKNQIHFTSVQNKVIMYSSRLSIGPKFIIDRLHILWGFCGFWRFGRLSFWFLNSQNDENLYLSYNIGEATNGHDSPMVKVELSPSCRWNTEALGSSLAGGPSAVGRGFWTQVECLRSTRILLLALRAPCLSKYSS